MKISALRLFNVKRFAGRGVAIEGISDGVNVLSEANEFGKSTTFEALHALFFQPHSSVAGDVKNLRPYSGGSPRVEADITTADGNFRIAKQYYGGRSAQVTDLSSGRLLAQADEAENFIANLIKGGAGGPAGLLWVRQGVTGIEKRKNAEEEGEREVRRSLLESVQGEVEAVTGGRRMAEIMYAVSAELDKLVTSRGPKAGGRYDTALRERDRLNAEEIQLAHQVAALRDALDRRSTSLKRLAELNHNDERQERLARINAAEATLEAARVQHERLRTAETELKLAREQRDAADRDMKTFLEALAKAEELREKLRAAGQRRSDAVGRRRDVSEAINTAQAALEAADVAEHEARARLARLEAAMKARDAAARLSSLQKTLSQAEAARSAIETGESQLALVRLPDNAVEEVQSLEMEIARLRAVAEAGRPSVTISYDNDTESRVSMDGRFLAEGEERGYNMQASLSVPGVGTITLRSNGTTNSDEALRKAEERRQELLDSLGVQDLSAARQQQARAEQLHASLREMHGRLSLLAPEGLTKLREDLAMLEAAQGEAIEAKENPAEVRALLTHAEEHRRSERQALRQIEAQRASADNAFLAAETEWASLNAALMQVDTMLGPELSRDEHREALQDALTQRKSDLAAIEETTRQLRATRVDLEAAEASLRRARSVHEAAEQEINTLRERVASLSATISVQSDEAVEEAWQETRDRLAAATIRAASFEREVAVLQRLSSALEAARAQARDLYLKPVMTELKPLLGLLFDDVSITFDDRTLLPRKILRNGQEEDVDRLSGGMREQLSVLTRLAFARLLARDGRPAPVILDDALVYSDDERIERMFDALHRQARDQQIIVFSCRQRAFQRLGGNVLRMRDWEP